MKISVLTIGDELLMGQVVNTNTSLLSKMVSEIGGQVTLQVSCADTISAIHLNLKNCLENCDLVLVSGGLGPTIDDLTVEAVAQYLNIPLEHREEALENARSFYVSRGREMLKINEKLALNPKGATLLSNDCGTASGVWIEATIHGVLKRIVLMPGVPYELKSMMEREVLKRLSPLMTGKKLFQRTWVCVGIGESALAEKLGDVTLVLGGLGRLAYLPSPDKVRLRVNVVTDDESKARALFDKFESLLTERVKKYFVGLDTEAFEEIVGRLLKEKNLTVAIAESCTGGRVLDRLTNISGSSSYVIGGVVAYSNSVKISQLGVSENTLQKFGAVSAETAREMALGVRSKLAANIGISITGVAGPTGGSPEKPVGLVFIGFTDGLKTETFKNIFDVDRLRNKEKASQTALNILRRYCLGEEL